MFRSTVSTGIGRLLLANCLALLPVGLSGQRVSPPYRAGWADVAVIGSAATIAAIPPALALPHGPPPCAPCDVGELWRVDRIAVHHADRNASRASDALLAGVVGGAAWASVRGVSAERARGDAAVMLEAAAWTGATTQWLKVLVHRSRPVLYTSAAPAAANLHDNRESFPSGHTSFAFAAATSYAVLAARQQLPHASRNSVLLMAGATGVGVLRVTAGQHFPTDVLAGAALGAGIGWLVAALHPTARPQ